MDFSSSSLMSLTPLDSREMFSLAKSLSDVASLAVSGVAAASAGAAPAGVEANSALASVGETNSVLFRLLLLLLTVAPYQIAVGLLLLRLFESVVVVGCAV